MDNEILRFSQNHETQLTQENGKSYIEGYAAVFYDGTPGTELPLGSFTERLEPGCFDKSLADGKPKRILFNHSDSHELGRTSLGTAQIWRDAKGYRYKCEFDPTDPSHVEVKRKIEKGLISGSSFHGIKRKWKFERDYTSGKDILRHIELEIDECGPCPIPAYSGTSALVRSAGKDEHLVKDYDAWKQTQERLAKLPPLD